MKNDEISKAMVETIKSPELESMTTDFSEILLDHLAELDGIAKDIPIIGSVVKVIKFGFAVKDITFLKKIGKFLWQLRDLPLSERAELVNKLEKDSGYKSDVGGKIILLLERADDFEKPKLIANAFKAYLYSNISYSQLQRVNFAIDHLFIGDINEFHLYYKNPEYHMEESTHQNFALCGLAYLIQLMDGGTNLKISEFGRVFAKHVLECS